MESEDKPADWPWHVINGEDLMEMLKRCHAGESPEDVYLESYVNSENHKYDESDG
jgi:hypothetical protein